MRPRPPCLGLAVHEMEPHAESHPAHRGSAAWLGCGQVVGPADLPHGGQRRRGKAVLGENPHSSRAWVQPEVLDGFEGLPTAVLDQCQYGLKHPTTGEPIRKRTRFVGQPLVLSGLHQRCDGSHDHAHIEGSVRVGDRSVSLAAWAGGYPLPLCRAILDGATRFLRAAPSSLSHGGLLAEEVLMNEEDLLTSDSDYAPTDWEAAPARDPAAPAAAPTLPSRDAAADGADAASGSRRFPIGAETKRAVEMAHRHLGHPSRSTLLRMLRLSGASEGAIQHAKEWRCDVCAAPGASQAPSPGGAAGTGLRVQPGAPGGPQVHPRLPW